MTGDEMTTVRMSAEKHRHRWIKSFFHQWCKCGARRPGS